MFHLICFILAVHSYDFDSWMSKFNKHFSAGEALRRRAIFTQNARFVEEFNKHNTFELSVEGPFAAHTHEEYLKTLSRRGYKEEQEEVKEESEKANEALKGFPETLDLREQGKVTEVKDQNPCGGCYAFGSLASLESRLLMIKGDPNTLDLSEEQIIRCSDNKGCKGGIGTVVYEYITANGIVQEKDYTFTATDGTCEVDLSKRFATVSGYKKVAKKNNNALKSELVNGVVGVAIDASSLRFQLYKKGIYHDTKCSTSILGLNHEISTVGYGKLDGKEYWIVKNSWGKSWGDKGYVLFAMEGNTCGITSDPIYPTGVKYI